MSGDRSTASSVKVSGASARPHLRGQPPRALPATALSGRTSDRGAGAAARPAVELGRPVLGTGQAAGNSARCPVPVPSARATDVHLLLVRRVTRCVRVPVTRALGPHGRAEGHPPRRFCTVISALLSTQVGHSRLVGLPKGHWFAARHPCVSPGPSHADLRSANCT